MFIVLKKVQIVKITPPKVPTTPNKKKFPCKTSPANPPPLADSTQSLNAIGKTLVGIP